MLSSRQVNQFSAVVVLILTVVSVVRAEVTVRVEAPSGATSVEVYWGIQRRGQIVASGDLSIESGQASTLRTDLPDGEALLFVTANRDELRSCFPSFGDLYQRIRFEVSAGDAEVAVRSEAWEERRLSAPGNLLTVHYHRFDADYESVGIWTWDRYERRRPADQETFEVGRDDFGLIFQLDTAGYGRPGDPIGLLPRLNGDWQHKDGGDRYWEPALGSEIYLVQDRDEVYREPPDVSPRLLSATLENESAVLVRFSHRLPIVDFPPQRFTIRGETGSMVPVAAVRPENERAGRANALVIRTGEPIVFTRQSYTMSVTGFRSRRIALGRVLLDPQRFFDPETPLGAVYSPAETRFGVFSPVARQVEVVLADAPTGGEVVAVHPLECNEHGVWSAAVAGDWAGKFYAYRLQGPGLDPAREVADIYAVCLAGPGTRGMIVDLDRTDPPGFDASAHVPLASPVDAIIYEMHVRDFTIAASSGVEAKGKFLGLTEAGTRLSSDPAVRTGLDHLVELGVSHVQIMPVQDFENQERPDDSYNWGYMPVFFNSPDGWYATVPVGPQRITEFKQVVQACHERGIGVIMDVVYNHAAAEASFEKLVPGYYFRRRPDGSFWNGSGCGNEFASEHPMARRFMIDSLKYWVTEYGVDGFRFDLLGLHDLETMKEIRRELAAIDPSILVYGEPWTGGASGLEQITDKRRIAGTGVGAFNDNFRDGIKGDRDGGAPGFIQTGDRIDRIRKGIKGAVTDWAREPTDCLTYAACHDNLTTWDKILQAAPNASPDAKKRMQRFAGLLVLTSQGIPFIHSGQEFCRSKGGSHNSYNLPDSVNRIDWLLKKRHHDVSEYYRGLIALRRAHPAFRLRTAEQIKERLAALRHPPSRKCLGYRIDAAGLPEESLATIIVLLNGDACDQEFKLPRGTWRVFADADRAGIDSLAEASETVTVKAHSGMVLGHD